jgi:hypothetical protein
MTLRYREYSPGVVTAILVVLPSTVYLLDRVLSDDSFTGAQLAFAIGMGTILSIAAIASLWLRADFDWKWRRARR